jgi:hypothetical protein
VSTTNPGTVAAFASLTTMAAQVDLSAAKSFSVSDEIYIGGATTQYKALHTNNYNSYAPTLTGTGASGTWSINVTGTAGSISGFNNPAVAATANTIVYRDGSGHITGNYIFGSYLNSTDDINTGTITHIMAKFGDNYHRSASAAKVATFISGQTMNIAGTSTNITAYTINQSVGTNSAPSFLTVRGRNVFGERVAVTSTASTAIDTQYNVTQLTLAATITTLTFNNVQSTDIAHMWTIVTLGGGVGYSITWPAAIKWPGATAPTVTTASGKRDIYQFITYDGGTNIYAIIVGQNL